MNLLRTTNVDLKAIYGYNGTFIENFETAKILYFYVFKYFYIFDHMSLGKLSV